MDLHFLPVIFAQVSRSFQAWNVAVLENLRQRFAAEWLLIPLRNASAVSPNLEESKTCRHADFPCNAAATFATLNSRETPESGRRCLHPLGFFGSFQSQELRDINAAGKWKGPDELSDSTYNNLSTSADDGALLLGAPI
jgi:hypothetical protein